MTGSTLVPGKPGQLVTLSGSLTESKVGIGSSKQSRLGASHGVGHLNRAVMMLQEWKPWSDRDPVPGGEGPPGGSRERRDGPEVALVKGSTDGQM